MVAGVLYVVAMGMWISRKAFRRFGRPTALTISERSREIGLMRAVEATRRSVRMVFAIEAGLLSAMGAIPGVVLAPGGGWLLLKAAGGDQHELRESRSSRSFS